MSAFHVKHKSQSQNIVKYYHYYVMMMIVLRYSIKLAAMTNWATIEHNNTQTECWSGTDRREARLRDNMSPTLSATLCVLVQYVYVTRIALVCLCAMWAQTHLPLLSVSHIPQLKYSTYRDTINSII